MNVKRILLVSIAPGVAVVAIILALGFAGIRLTSLPLSPSGALPHRSRGKRE